MTKTAAMPTYGNKMKKKKIFYLIPSDDSSAYLEQIKGILSIVKKYRMFSLVTNTIYFFSL